MTRSIFFIIYLVGYFYTLVRLMPDKYKNDGNLGISMLLAFGWPAMWLLGILLAMVSIIFAGKDE